MNTGPENGMITTESLDVGKGLLPTSGQVESTLDMLSSPTIPRSRIIEILTSPDMAADFFRTRLPWMFPKGTVLKETRPTIFRNRVGSSQVVSYRLILSGNGGQKAGPLNLVIKRYVNKAEGRRIYSIMKMLWENGFDRSSRLRIPEPFAYLDDLGLMIIETVQGELLLRALPRSDTATLARMRDVARWLAKLHYLPADSDQMDPHTDDEASIRDFVQKAGSVQPQFRTNLEEVADLTLGRLTSLRSMPQVKIHGDFQCENVFIHRGTVSVIDFDRVCRSDPARDVGYIIAQTRLMGHLIGASSDSVYLNLKAFWDEYRTLASSEEREALSIRTCAFAARKCLQNFFYMAYVVPGGRMDALPLLLAETWRFAKVEKMEEVLTVPISDVPSGSRKIWQAITGVYGQTITGVYGDDQQTVGSIWPLFRDLSTVMVRIASGQPARIEPLFNFLARLSEADILITGGPSDQPGEPLIKAADVLVSLCRVVAGLKEDSPEWDDILTDYFQAFEEALSGYQDGKKIAGPSPVSSETSRIGFLTRAAKLVEPEFIKKVVYPAIINKSSEKVDRLWAIEPLLAQEDRGTGRQTVGYRVGGEVLAFGKHYPSSIVPPAFRVMQRLRETGLGDGSYQAVEPLAFVPDHNFLLTKKARGRPLMDFIGQQGPGVVEKVRQAARWLVRLHESSIRIGVPESIWGSMRLFTLIYSLAQLSAQRPGEKDLLIDMIGRLFKRATEKRGAIHPVVQLHGSFHCDHIYLDDERVTVIDFDKSRPGDPAQDLAEFLSLWRRRTFKRTGSIAPADESTRAFIEEYASRLPDNLQDLSVYWAGAVLHDLSHYRKREGDEQAQRMVVFLQKDFEAVLSGEMIGAAA